MGEKKWATGVKYPTKRPCFGGLTFKNTGHLGSRYIYHQCKPNVVNHSIHSAYLGTPPNWGFLRPPRVFEKFSQPNLQTSTFSGQKTTILAELSDLSRYSSIEIPEDHVAEAEQTLRCLEGLRLGCF